MVPVKEKNDLRSWGIIGSRSDKKKFNEDMTAAR